MKRNRQEETENMACEICLTKFGFLKRKRECFECRGECCSSCLVKEQGRNTCKRCRVLLAIPPDPSALMRLKVKDLKQFLCRKHVAHQGCTQKDELVDLVLQMAVNSSRQPPRAHTSVNTSPSHSSAERGSSSLPQGFSTRYSPSGDQRSSSSSQQQATFQSSTNSYAQSHWQPPNLASSQEDISQTSQAQNEHHQQTETKLAEPLASLENLTSEDAINALSVRQLKLLLLRHFVDYKGCCEKTELQDRVRRLWRQHKETEDIDPDLIPNEHLCKICWEAPINCVLLECGHMATCTECGKRMHECPICRQYVVRVVHTFKA